MLSLVFVRLGKVDFWTAAAACVGQLDVFVRYLTASRATDTKKELDYPVNGLLIDNRHILVSQVTRQIESFHVRMCTTDGNKRAASSSSSGTGSISCLFDVINGGQ